MWLSLERGKKKKTSVGGGGHQKVLCPHDDEGGPARLCRGTLRADDSEAQISALLSLV